MGKVVVHARTFRYTPRPMPRSMAARVLLAIAMLAGLVARIAITFTDDGIYWPDEIYQSFEPAHKLVFGYGVIPWEFVQGARTWVLPGLVAAILKVCALFGASAGTFIHVVKLAFVAASMAAALGVYRLSQVLNDEAPKAELASAAAASLWALCAASLYFAPRAMTENASAASIIWGLALVLDPKASRKLIILGASLLGLSVLFRLQSSVFCVGSVVMLALRSRKAPTQWKVVLAVLTGWAAFFGVLDALTWHDAPGARYGGLFHSVFVYVRFNVIEGQGARWGTAPWQYYAEHLWAVMPAITVLLVAGALLSLRRAPGLVITAFVFVAIHAAVAHKEFRFLVPVLPVLCALVGYGLNAVSSVPAARAALPATVLLAALSGWSSQSLTMGDLGAYLDRPGSSAWNDFGNVNRLMLEAGKRDDVCGLRIDIAHLAWTGGSTYFHRPVPLYMPNYPVNSGHFNYVITYPNSGAEVIARDHGIELVRLPGSPCTPDPGYSWLLP